MIVRRLLIVLVLLTLVVLPVSANPPPQGTWQHLFSVTLQVHDGFNSVDWVSFNPPTQNGHYYMFVSTGLTYTGNRGPITLGLYGNRSFSQTKVYPYSNFFKPDPNQLTGGAKLYASPMGCQLLLQSNSNVGTVIVPLSVYYWVPAGQ